MRRSSCSAREDRVSHALDTTGRRCGMQRRTGGGQGLGENWLTLGGGGGRSSPFAGPPPSWAPVTGTPDGLTVTPPQADRGGCGGGGPEAPQHI